MWIKAVKKTFALFLTHLGITNADFTPDGDYLLLLTTLPGMVIYDTENWREVRSLPNLPKGASLHFPSSDWKYGIVVHADGDAALWDAESRRQVSKIDIDGGLFAVAFSPDDSMVATSSGHENNGHYPTLHLRIWNVGTGDMVEELRPSRAPVQRALCAQMARRDLG